MGLEEEKKKGTHYVTCIPCYEFIIKIGDKETRVPLSFGWRYEKDREGKTYKTPILELCCPE